MALTNYAEKFVCERLNEYIALHPKEFCTCSQCVDDIMSLALNRLPPKYVATSKGEVLTENELSEPFYQAKVLTEVIRAIGTVQKKPSHS